MPAPRAGRIHLIYQSIILTMLAMFIGYHELLSERKYVYLSIICLFLLTIMILFCYTELLPIQTWMSKYSSESSENNEESYKKGSENSEHRINTSQEEARTERDENKSESLNKSRVYKLRNWKKDGSTENKSIKRTLSIFDASSIVPMENIGEYNFGSYSSKESDVTKRYYFPFRQKRLEEWVDSKESRPYKIRPWELNHQANAESSTDSSEVLSSKNADQPVSSMSPQSADLGIPKSYSFPFRRKRLEHWMEIQEHQKANLEISSSLPQWEAIDYPDYDEFRVRRSLSGSALDSEELESAKINKEKDFSQSVEVTYASSVLSCNHPTSPSNAIDKIKAGFKDYFSKMRKDSFKGKGDSKRRNFRSFFQSKENISFNIAEKKSSKLEETNEFKF